MLGMRTKFCEPNWSFFFIVVQDPIKVMITKESSVDSSKLILNVKEFRPRTDKANFDNLYNNLPRKAQELKAEHCKTLKGIEGECDQFYQ